MRMQNGEVTPDEARAGTTNAGLAAAANAVAAGTARDNSAGTASSTPTLTQASATFWAIEGSLAKRSRATETVCSAHLRKSADEVSRSVSVTYQILPVTSQARPPMALGWEYRN